SADRCPPTHNRLLLFLRPPGSGLRISLVGRDSITSELSGDGYTSPAVIIRSVTGYSTQPAITLPQFEAWVANAGVVHIDSHGVDQKYYPNLDAEWLGAPQLEIYQSEADAIYWVDRYTAANGYYPNGEIDYGGVKDLSDNIIGYGLYMGHDTARQ